jgi:hypothetical protein
LHAPQPKAESPVGNGANPQEYSRSLIKLSQ